MKDRHWSNDDLLQRLYGLRPDDPHLAECEDCRRRWLALGEARRHALAEPEIAADVLERQRREVYRRLGENDFPMAWRPLAPVLAMAALFVLGTVLLRPVPEPQPSLASDTQFFAEIDSELSSAEPRAAEPIHALFED
jgi:hypothetical protein